MEVEFPLPSPELYFFILDRCSVWWARRASFARGSVIFSGVEAEGRRVSGCKAVFRNRRNILGIGAQSLLSRLIDIYLVVEAEGVVSELTGGWVSHTAKH